MAEQIYDTIGRGYLQHRKPDPFIQKMVHEALGNSHQVLNVGAGSGSYEPNDRNLIAVEPSMEMISQRPTNAAVAVSAKAENLPFPDKFFDASMAILTVHHWLNLDQGLSEMQRVTRDQIVILTFDPDITGFWLEDYFPELRTLGRHGYPTMTQLLNTLCDAKIQAVPIPSDCCDGFMGAYWSRPRAYLDIKVRQSISAFSMLSATTDGLQKLQADLNSGEWREKYAHILTTQSLDLGYRLVVARVS